MSPPVMTATQRRAPARRGVTSVRVVRAEWTKLASVRSTWWVALGTVLAAAALAYGLGLFVRPGDARSGVSVAVSGFALAQLGSLVLGALVGAEEYGTGTFRATFAAVPRRLPVLAAQAVLTATVALVTAVVALGASALATTGARAGSGLVLDATDGETARVALGFVLYLTGVALLGLGLGALLRRPAAALVTGVLLVVVLDQLLAANPGRFADTARALLPGAGSRLLLDDARLAALDGASLGPVLGTWGGGLVLAAWAALVLVAAGYRLARHDLR